MKQQQLEWLLIVAGFIVLMLGFGLAWFIYPWVDRSQTPYILGGVALLLLIAGFILNSFIQSYIFGTRRLQEETQIILAANPAHRLKLDGPSDLKQLAEAINIFADRYQETLDNQVAQIAESQTALEEEKNRLAALMSELTEGVLVCNPEGRILLYNNRAKQLLGHSLYSSWGGRVGGFVGLGRSVFGLIGRNTIIQALEDLAYRMEKQRANLVAQFVTSATNGQLIRARVAPILSQKETINGFVLTLEDVTQQSQRSQRRDTLLQALTEGVRASLANIRTAIETIEQFPEMDAAKLLQMRRVIADESLTLSTRLKQITTEYDADLRSDWQLDEMLGSDLLWATQRRLEDKLEAVITVIEQESNLWLKVDSYAIVLAMTYLMRRLKTDFGLIEVQLRLMKLGQLAAFDLAWENNNLNMDTLWSWQNQPLTTEEDNSTLTLRDVAERHGGEVWCQMDSETNIAYFRLLLPTTQPKPLLRTLPKIQSSRPEYYDFDLFQQAGQTPELDQQPLTRLTYTVFDTETTGLNPSAGDEIISISAIRIVNGRLLREEIFDQLVDPRRPVSPESIEIHGISEEMLQGQPTIEQILPHMYRFTEGTVLVGHNAAFDMRLLQLKEAKTGIKFTNPVLDTLLLSAVLHPNETDYSLETIAQRLGITVLGRHTSLGDTMLTGEIFLKLIPLLKEQGIVTLGDALRTTEKTYYARLSY